LFLGFISVPQPAEAAVYIVNDLGDFGDGGCDVGSCTLREAIVAANTHFGPDTIQISIASGSPNWVIWLDSELPSINDDNTTIDATTMPEFLGGPSVVLVGDDDISYGFNIRSNGNTIRGFKFSSFRGGDEGAPIIVHGNENIIEDNVMPNSTHGIILEGRNNHVVNNLIGVMPWGDASANDSHGVVIRGSLNVIENNVIAYNGGAGIYLPEDSYFEANTFSRNSIYDNAELGIDITNNNARIDPPDLLSVGLTEVSGEACRGCTVEVFLADPDPSGYGEGMTFLGVGDADSVRNFTISLDTPVEDCDSITATVTSSRGDTSEFALNRPAGDCMTLAAPPLYEPYLTVNTTDDDDDGYCTEEHCSLREAINFANGHPGGDTITFDIDGLLPHTIRVEPRSYFPAITNDHTVIDGTSEPDYHGSPVVRVQSVGPAGDAGLTLDSSHNAIRGLIVDGFGLVQTGDYAGIVGAGISVRGSWNFVEGNVVVSSGGGIIVRGNHNTIQGNTAGSSEAGDGNGNLSHGITVSGHDNLIGGAGSGEGNIISGNGGNGILLCFAEGNTIMGNIIGADASGTIAIPNELDGIFTQADNLTIGGLGVGEGNLIFGNGRHGIHLYDTSGPATLVGNTIRDNAEFGIFVDSLVFNVHTFTQNSIYDNGDLGIETNRVDDHIPDIDSATETHVEGFACRGCLVEVFLAAADPSGYGEGKTYLGEARADVAGNWELDISGVDTCDAITATATDADGETSEFAENRLARCYSLPMGPMSAFGLLGLLSLGGLLILVRVVWPQAPTRLVPVGLVAGFVGVVAVFLLVLILPNFQLTMSASMGGEAAPPEPLPECTQMLAADGFTPFDGTVFAIDEDPIMAWQPSDEADETTRWRVDLRTPDQSLHSLTTDENSLALSEFGVEARPGGRYEWRLYGELPAGQNEPWDTICNPDAVRWFYFENPALEAQPALVEEPEVEEEPEEEEPEEEAVCIPTATALMNATCREGPQSEYKDVGYLLEGESAEIEGRNAEGSWWYIFLAGKMHCWVWSGAVETTCDVNSLSIVAAPPLPVKTSTPTEVPQDETPPPAPNPDSPTGGVTLACTSNAVLDWDPVSDESGISSYTVQLQVSYDNVNWSTAPGSPFTTTATEQSVSVDCGGYYRWRVRATDGASNQGSYSAWAYFQVTLN
jgi:CSLREA domain-containing protein